MQDFGTFSGLHIWVELEDDSLRVNDQTRLFLFIKNENKEVTANNIEIKLSMKPKGPTIIPNPLTIENVVPGRTVREILPINVGNSKKGKYELRLSVEFQLVPGTWGLGPLPFQVQ